MARRNAYAEQAANQSILRFGPEESVLAALLRDAEERFGTASRQAKSARQYTVAAVDAATPQLQQAYQAAGQAVSPAFTSGGGVEASALQARLAESQAQAAQQLQARRVGAYEGEGAARSQALRDLASDRGKVLQRLQDLQQEKGAFTTSTIADLVGADRKAEADAAELQSRLDQQERNSIRSSGIDPDTGQPIPGGKLDQKAKSKSNQGRGWASQAAHTKAADMIGTAISEAQALKRAGATRAEVAEMLLSGQDVVEQPVYRTVKLPNGTTKQERVLWKPGEIDPATGKEVDASRVGTQKTRSLPAVPKIPSQLYLSAALDQLFDGHLSRRTQQLLHRRGIRIEPLGLTSYGTWRQGRGKVSRPGNAPGANGQLRPT